MANKYISKIVIGSDTLHIKDVEARESQINVSQKGVANGVATLNANGYIPASLIRSASVQTCQDIVDELL